MTPFRYHPFDLRQLVSFAEIARTGSYRSAAKTLHVAQPALSRQIQNLGAALGISLFDRAPRRLRLTLEGRELATRLPAFSRIWNNWRSVRESRGTAEWVTFELVTRAWPRRMCWRQQHVRVGLMRPI